MKIITILGARPQFIKAGTVSREIGEYENIEEINQIHLKQNINKLYKIYSNKNI